MNSGVGFANLGIAISNTATTLATLEYNKRQAEAKALAEQLKAEQEAQQNAFINNTVAEAIEYRRKLVSQGVHPSVAAVNSRLLLLRKSAEAGIDASKTLSMFNSSIQQPVTSTTSGIQTTTLPGTGTMNVDLVDAAQAFSFLNPEDRDKAIEKYQSGDARQQQEALGMVLEGVFDNEQLKLLNNKITTYRNIRNYTNEELERLSKPVLVDLLGKYTKELHFKEYQSDEEVAEAVRRNQLEFNQILWKSFDVVTPEMERIVKDYYNTVKESLSNTELRKLQSDRDSYKALVDLQDYVIRAGMPEDLKRMQALAVSNPELFSLLHLYNRGAAENLYSSLVNFIYDAEYTDIKNKNWGNITDTEKLTNPQFRSAIVADLYKNGITDEEKLREYIKSSGEYTDEDVQMIIDILDESFKEFTGFGLVNQLHKLKKRTNE